MNTYSSTRPAINPKNFLAKVNPAVIFAIIIVTALLAFEMFNYSTTEHALSDLLGKLTFAGMRWATILSIAFCGIDFAGIARLFTPERGADEPKEVWYLFGAWLLAATMNAVLTWWGISMAVANRELESTAIMDNKTLTQVVPVFVALMVWVIRILIIGTISVAGERFIWGNTSSSVRTVPGRSATIPSAGAYIVPRPAAVNSGRSVISPRPNLSARPTDNSAAQPEPTYHSISASPRPAVRPSPLSENNSGKRMQ
jgi:hypothetical protein